MNFRPDPLRDTPQVWSTQSYGHRRMLGVLALNSTSFANRVCALSDRNEQ